MPDREKSPEKSGRQPEMDRERNAFPGSGNIDDDMDDEVSSDMEAEEEDVVLDEEDLEENELTDEEAEDIEWEEPSEGETRNS